MKEIFLCDLEFLEIGNTIQQRQRSHIAGVFFWERHNVYLLGIRVDTTEVPTTLKGRGFLFHPQSLVFHLGGKSYTMSRGLNSPTSWGTRTLNFGLKIHRSWLSNDIL